MPWFELVKSSGGEQRGEQPVARGVARVHGLHHRAEHLAQARRLGCGDAERPHHLLLCQAEQAARRGRGAKHAGRTGNVPAHVVVGGINGIADAAFRFHPQYERVQEVLALHRRLFREREDGRGNGAAGVDDCFQVRVVEIEDVRAGAVQERGQHRIDSFAPPEHRRLRRPRELNERGEGAVYRLVPASAYRAAHPVEERPRRLVPDFLRDVTIVMRNYELCECLGNFHKKLRERVNE